MNKRRVDLEDAMALVAAMERVEDEWVPGGLRTYLGDHSDMGRVLVVVAPGQADAVVVTDR